MHQSFVTVVLKINHNTWAWSKRYRINHPRSDLFGLAMAGNAH